MNLKKRYKDYDPRVIEALELVVKNIEFDDAYLLQLDLLAVNYMMLFESIDSIKTQGFTIEYENKTVKNHAVQTLNNCQQTIIKLLNSFPTNPLSKAKIKKLNDVGPDDSCPLDEFV